MKISVIAAAFNNRDTITKVLDSALMKAHSENGLALIDGGFQVSNSEPV